MTATDSNND